MLLNQMVWKNCGWLHLIPRAGDDISGFWKSKTENPQDCVFLPLLNLSQSMQWDDHAFAAFIFFWKLLPSAWKLPLVYNFNQRHFFYNLIEESNVWWNFGIGLISMIVKFEELRKVLPWGIKKYLLVLAHDVNVLVKILTHR